MEKINKTFTSINAFLGQNRSTILSKFRIIKKLKQIKCLRGELQN